MDECEREAIHDEGFDPDSADVIVAIRRVREMLRRCADTGYGYAGCPVAVPSLADYWSVKSVLYAKKVDPKEGS